MSHSLDWQEIALRLVLAALVGGLFGFNRTEHGHAAGLRTTLLVCLAACLAMVEADLIVAQTEGEWNSVFRLDVMRLPLGILSGIGFIGAGAIIRRGELVRGLTTAATLWIVTVIGICLGGGQIWLGLVGAALGFFALWLLSYLEAVLHPNRHGSLSLTTELDGPTDEAVRDMLRAAGVRLRATSVIHDPAQGRRRLQYDFKFRDHPETSRVRNLAQALADTPRVLSIQWRCYEN